MTGEEVLIDETRHPPAAARLVDGQLQDLVFDPPNSIAPGAIFRAKVVRVVKGAAFVELPGGQGYLRKNNVKAGQTVLVQVSTVTEPGKATPVTDRLVFKGRWVIVTPGAEGRNVSRQIRDEDERLRLNSAVDTLKAATSTHGIVVRTAATKATDKEVAYETDMLLELADTVLADAKGPPEHLFSARSAQDYAMQEWVIDPETPVSFERGCLETRGVEDDIERLRSSDVSLGSGWMSVEATRALVAVDVNTGSDTSPSAALKVNIAVARELPRQLRLRGLGGKIAVDFAPMPKNQRRSLEEALKKAFRGDPIETSLVGWTTLGLFELQRKRERWPLRELL